MKRFLFVFLVSATACVWAQPAPSVLPEVVVTATRVDTPTLETPAFVTVISAQQIADSPSASLPELLESKGLTVRNAGPQGALSTAGIRGSTTGQVLVLVDGVPMNSSRDGTVDLSQIPLDMIDHIEIVRGGESSVYGSAAIGGVINIITKKQGKSTTFSTQIVNGSYIPHGASLVSSGMVQTPTAANPLDLVDTQKFSASGSTRIGAVGVTATGGFTRAANGFTWNDQTYINGWRRENHAGGSSGNGYLNIDAPVGHGNISATGSFVSTSYDVAGTLSGFGLTTQAEQQRTGASGSVRFTTNRLLNTPIGLNTQAFYQYDNLHYADPSIAVDSTHVTNTVGADLTANISVSDLASLIYGASVRYDHVDSTDLGLRSRLNLAGYVSSPFSPTDRLTLTPSLRYDYFSDVTSGLSYRLGAVLALNSWSSLKASLSESYRVPSMDALYWPGYSNPNLKPETAFATDFGYTVRRGPVSFDAALFTRFVLDQILNTATEPLNLGKSLLPGAEMTGRLALGKHLSLSLDYSFIYSLLLNDGSTSYTAAADRRVPYVPVHSAGAEIAYSRGGARVAFDGRYVSTRYTDGANTQATALAPHILFNLSYLQDVGSGLSISLTVKNLLNAVYQTQLGYPMPPLSLWTGLRLAL